MSVASTAQHSIPSANQPIVSTDQAISLFAAAISHPLTNETVAFLIDGCNRANTIVVVSGTEQPDDVIEVAEIMAMTGSRSAELCGLVIASVRSASLLLPGDLDRWWNLQAITDSHGIELVEWIVVGPGGIECPRQLVGEPERW